MIQARRRLSDILEVLGVIYSPTSKFRPLLQAQRKPTCEAIQRFSSALATLNAPNELRSSRNNYQLIGVCRCVLTRFIVRLRRESIALKSASLFQKALKPPTRRAHALKIQLTTSWII